MARLPALPFVRTGITEGLSANAALNRYVETAHAQDLTGIRRQDFLRLYSSTQALRGQAAAAMAAPRDTPHGGLTPQPRPVSPRFAGGYGYWVGMYSRERGGGPTTMEPWLMRSREPMTPEEAEARAGELWAAGERDYDRAITGIGFLGVERFVRP